eukprot:2583526-Amphidinium_carterae.1
MDAVPLSGFRSCRTRGFESKFRHCMVHVREYATVDFCRVLLDGTNCVNTYQGVDIFLISRWTSEYYGDVPKPVIATAIVTDGVNL